MNRLISVLSAGTEVLLETLKKPTTPTVIQTKKETEVVQSLGAGQLSNLSQRLTPETIEITTQEDILRLAELLNAISNVESETSNIERQENTDEKTVVTEGRLRKTLKTFKDTALGQKLTSYAANYVSHVTSSLNTGTLPEATAATSQTPTAAIPQFIDGLISLGTKATAATSQTPTAAIPQSTDTLVASTFVETRELSVSSSVVLSPVFKLVFLTVLSLTLLSAGASFYLASKDDMNQQQNSLFETCTTTWKMGVGAIFGLLGTKTADAVASREEKE